MRTLRKVLKFTYLMLIALLLCLALLFALLQTKWVQEKIAARISTFSASCGIGLEMSHPQGRFPFTWHIERLQLALDTGTTIDCEEVTLRLAILPLLSKTLSISHFTIEKAYCAFSAEVSHQEHPLNDLKAKVEQWEGAFSIPYRVVLHRLKIQHCILENRKTNTLAHFSLVAKGELQKRLEGFYTDITFSSQNYALNAHVNASSRLNRASLQIKAHLDSAEIQDIFYIPEPLECSFSLKGSWANWRAFFQEKPMSSPLKLSCNVDSRLFHMNAKGTIALDEKSELQLSLTLPDLSHFTKDKLRGSLQGEIFLAKGQIKGDICVSEARHRQFALEQLFSHIEARQIAEGWEGSAQISTQVLAGEKPAQPKSDSSISLCINEIPLSGSCAFLFKPFSPLTLSQVTLEGPELFLSGDIAIDMQSRLVSGDIYGQCEHLNPYAFLLQQKALDGSLNFMCHLSPEKEKQNISCFLLGKNLLYNKIDMEQMRITATLKGHLKQMRGEVDCLLENISTPLCYVDSLDIKAYSDEENWLFRANAQADVFTFFAQGSWTEEEKLRTVEIDALSGDFFSHAFTLKYPVLFEQSQNYTLLSSVQMNIGEGDLFAVCDLSRVRSTAEITLHHFPLATTRWLFRGDVPSGTLSASGFFDATPDNLEGALQATLEDVSFRHFTENKPLTVKGTLQAHVDNNLLQMQALVRGSGEQSIDINATLPLMHTLYPFNLCLTKNKPVFAECVVDAKLEELFDFINLGTHRATGFLSTRLLLSQTLSSPALQGELLWENGSYENYITGTSLKEIEAKMQAVNNQIDLTSFTATDGKRGTVVAEGSLDLDPSRHFPYKLIAELDALNSLHISPIDAQLTGSLYIQGTTQGALAQGNLIVPSAEIRLPETLAVEIPQLPVTWANFPGCLSSETVMPKTFPFHIELELTADEKVIVKGKGLDSEWKGTLFLTGTNMNVAARGTLELIKGEYALFGKTFKLTEGEILFSDKPSSSATINLTGTLSLSGSNITANLRGPFYSPTMTLQSNPQMSTSAILARILFNKDISDISQPEAIQLATTLISLSGGAGPSVLDTIRKNIGVDRLTIASQTSNPDEVAVQIGKYLTKGVMITLSQSATSSQIIVEVEFKHGFVFQAETQAQEEGKFSLKWTHSY